MPTFHGRLDHAQVRALVAHLRALAPDFRAAAPSGGAAFEEQYRRLQDELAGLKKLFQDLGAATALQPGGRRTQTSHDPVRPAAGMP